MSYKSNVNAIINEFTETSKSVLASAKKLEFDNVDEFKSWMEDRWPTFGKYGLELCDGADPCEEPVKPKEPSKYKDGWGVNAHGLFGKVRERWVSGVDCRNYEKDMDTYRDKMEMHNRMKGVVHSFLRSVTGEEIKKEMESKSKDVVNLCRQSGDNRRLLALMFETANNLAKLGKTNLVKKWNEFSQGNLSCTDFFLQSESKVSTLKRLGEVRSDSRQTAIMRLNANSRFEIPFSSLFLGVEEGDEGYPTLEKLKKVMTAHDQAVAGKISAQGGTTGNGNSAGERGSAARAFSVQIDDSQKRPNYCKQCSKSDFSPSAWERVAHNCHNCGETPDHRSLECPFQKAKCAHCSGLGHLKQYCNRHNQLLRSERKDKAEEQKAKPDSRRKQAAEKQHNRREPRREVANDRRRDDSRNRGSGNRGGRDGERGRSRDRDRGDDRRPARRDSRDRREHRDSRDEQQKRPRHGGYAVTMGDHRRNTEPLDEHGEQLCDGFSTDTLTHSCSPEDNIRATTIKQWLSAWCDRERMHVVGTGRLPNLRDIPSDMRDLPRAWMATCYRMVVNEAVWSRKEYVYSDDELQATYRSLSIDSNGDAIPLLNTAGFRETYHLYYDSPSVRKDVYGYMLSAHTSRNNEDGLLIDSCCGISIIKLLRNAPKDAKPNFDKAVTVVGLDHNSPLPVTHTGYMPNVGDYRVVPGAGAELISLVQLRKHGYQVTSNNEPGRTDLSIKSPMGFAIDVHFNEEGLLETTRKDFRYLVCGESFDRSTPQGAVTSSKDPYRPAPELSYLSRNAKGRNEARERRIAPNVRDKQTTAQQRSIAEKVRILHNSMCHPSDETLINLLRNNSISGIGVTAKDIAASRAIIGPCLACIAGKTTKPSFGPSGRGGAKEVADVVHADILSLRIASVGGYECYLFCVDECSGMKFLIPCKSKSHTDLNLGFDELIGEFTVFGHKIKVLQTDGENTLTACTLHLRMAQILLAQTPPNQHAQLLERNVRTLNERVRTILASLPYELPQQLYGELLYAVTYSLNDLPTSNNTDSTPRMQFTGRKLDLSNRILVAFGTVAMLHHAGFEPNDKFDARASLGIILGPSENTYGCVRAYSFETGRIVNRSDFTPLYILPENFPWPIRTMAAVMPVPHMAEDLLTRGAVAKTANKLSRRARKKSVRELRLVIPNTIHSAAYDNSQPAEPAGDPRVTAIANPGPTHPETRNPPAEGVLGRAHELAPTPRLVPSTKKRVRVVVPPYRSTKSKQSHTSAADHRVYRRALPAEDISRTSESLSRADREGVYRAPEHSTLLSSRKTANATPESSGTRRSNREPKGNWQDGPSRLLPSRLPIYKISMRQALDGDRSQDAREAIRDEIMNMLTYKVGHHCHLKDVPLAELENILHSFMFLKEKTKPDGSYDKTKARMVGNGATQKDHMYDLISSSTVALATVFMLFNIASYHRTKMVSYDVKGAFLNAKFGPADPAHYLKVNKDVTRIWVEMDPSAAPYVDDRGELLLKLDRFIYGLKQAPYKFQEHLKAFLIKLGYVQTVNDPCLYIKSLGADYSIISTHVDDILQVATLDSLVRELHEALLEEYTSITFNENADAYIGMSIKRSADLEHIELTQTGLIDKILDKYSPGRDTETADPNSDRLFHTEGASDWAREPFDQKEYLGLVMSLMYLARLTRPDILLPVAHLSTRSHCCTRGDMQEAYKVCKYLRGTRDRGIHIHCTSMRIHAECDASHQVHTDMKSHTGYKIGFGDTLSFLHCKSNKQKLCAQSSTDAEVLAMVDCLKMCVWLRNLLQELHITPLKRMVIYQDNKSAIIMAQDDTSKAKNSKHILTKITYARDLRKLDMIEFVYLPTRYMTADMLTKPLHGEQFRMHRSKLMGTRRGYSTY